MVLLAAAVRLASRTGPGVQFDEAQGIWIARLPTAGSVVTFLAEHESHPPLYYFILQGWMAAFGDTQASVEALSLAFAVATVAAIVAVGMTIFSTRVGLLAGLLAAFSPGVLSFDTLVRPYPILSFLWIASTYALWRALRGGSGSVIAWVVHVLATSAMLYIHNWAFMALGGQGLVTLCWIAAGHRWRTFVFYTVAELAIAALYSPWVPTLLHQVGNAGYGPDRTGAPERIVRYFTDSLLLPGYKIGLPIALALIASGLICRRLRPASARQPVDASGFLLFTIAPLVAFGAAVALSKRSDLVHPHVLLVIAPGTALGLGLALDQLSGPGRWRATAIGLAVALAVDWRYTGPMILRPQPRSLTAQAAAVVDRQARPGDVICVVPQWQESSFDYHSKAKNPRVRYPDEEYRGAFFYDGTASRLLDPTRYRRAKAALAEARREGRRVWFVLSDSRLAEFAPTAPPEVDEPPAFEGISYSKIGQGRAIQLRSYLAQLYGSPGSMVFGRDRPPSEQGLTSRQYVNVYLFSPPGPSGSGATIPAAPSGVQSP